MRFAAAVDDAVSAQRVPLSVKNTFVERLNHHEVDVRDAYERSALSMYLNMRLAPEGIGREAVDDVARRLGNWLDSQA